MKKGEETRQKLIQIALDLFHQHGVHWVSFQQIGTRLGISQPALYKHFKDKDDLIQACVLAAAQSGRGVIDQHVQASANARDRLRSYIEANFIWLKNNPKEGAAVLAMYYFSYNSPPIQQLMTSINHQSVERIATHLAHGNHENSWSIDDCRSTARIIHDMLMGEMIKAIHAPYEMQINERLSLVWSVVEKLLK